MTDHIDQLAAALVAFQGEVPVIPKNRTAKIPTKAGSSYTYKFADLADMWEAIRVPLHRNGLAVTQTLLGGSTGWTTIRTKVWHQSGQTDAGEVEVPTGGRTPQEVGSLLTYYKRYALSAALGISTDDDDDGNGASQAKVAEKTRVSELPPSLGPAEIARVKLKGVCAKKKVDLAVVAKRFADDYGVAITEAQADTIEAFTKVLADE